MNILSPRKRNECNARFMIFGKVAAITGLVLGLVAASAGAVPSVPSPDTAMTAFSLNSVPGSINETNKTIAVIMPSGAKVTALIATFATTGSSVTVGGKTQASGATANDFTRPVTYTVTAADATTVNYTVTVTVTAPLPDTGITANQCYQAGSDVLVSCTSAAAIALNANQDGMVGRDVTESVHGDGKLGFSYSEVSGGCVKDNVSGLIWEIKTTDGGLRDRYKSYTNIGDGRDGDASAYVTAVNAARLCGYSDWRLPTAEELLGIVDYSVVNTGAYIAYADLTWFPHMLATVYWTSSISADDSDNAWMINFGDGHVDWSSREKKYFVRLVR